MKFFKNPIIAILLAIAIILSSTAISVTVKLNSKCNEVIDGFYYGTRVSGQLMKSVYYNLNDLCELTPNVIAIADNYGISTKELSTKLRELREEISYHNKDIDSIYEEYDAFYSALFAVLLELSDTGLSERHLEYMASASEQISAIRLSIDNSGYNESVRSFYKKFNKFPVKIFAELFDIDYPEFFA